MLIMATPDASSLESVTSPQEETDLEGQMSLMDHLQELRNRLLKAAVAVLITTMISFVFADQLVEFLTAPIGGRQVLESIDPTENIGVFMRVSLISGLALAMPVIVYQVIRFVVPGLTREERRSLWIIVPTASLLFVAGAAFAYFMMLPVALPFLIGFLDIPTRPRPQLYFGFVGRLMFWIGASFETPLILAFLARLGIVTPEFLKRNRRYAIVLIAVIAAVITPTVDPVSMLLVMAPLILLYELGVFISRIAYRQRRM
jgi:sec-independent protein translocase protein TatC